MLVESVLMILAGGVFAAGRPPVEPCVVKTEKGYREPATLSLLLTCQSDALGQVPTLNNALLDFQHEEVREYLRRHPERATTADGEEDEREAPPEPDGAEPSKDPKKPLNRDPDAAAKASGEVRRRSAAALERNMENVAVPEDMRQSFRDLRKAMWEDSPDGQFGVTPEMSNRIMKFLIQNQGGVSAEMSHLLKSASKDGVNLSHDTMRQLKRAARKGKRHGLDIGVEPNLERWLLDPKSDPTGKEGGAPARPGGKAGGIPLN